MANLGSFLSPYEILSTAQENKYLGIFFLFDHEIACLVYSTYNDLVENRILLPDLAPWLSLSGSNYQYFEHISIVPNMFEPMKFDCIYVLHVLFAQQIRNCA